MGGRAQIGEPTERLVQVALETSDEALAATGRRAAARTFFDFIACATGGAQMLPHLSWPVSTAGRLAVSAHCGDQDDLHLRSLTHPGGVVWSAVVEAALERDVELSHAIRAAALGYEVTVRLAEALGVEHRQRWHATTTAGAVGAAAASALVLADDAAYVTDAVGHALSVAGGSIQAVIERSDTRLLHRAHAANTGVACARAAGAGLTASRFGLEHERGIVAFESPALFVEQLLGARPASAIEETGFRLYAATGFAHAAIDAALEIGPLDPAVVTDVRVAVAPPAAVLLASDPEPENGEEAWWSIEHAVAVCLCSGDAGALLTGLTERDDVRRLCRRVRLESAGDGWQASVEVLLEGGERQMVSVAGPRGHGDHPASDDDLGQKWLRLCGRDGLPVLERLLNAGDDPPLRTILAEALDPYPAFARLLGESTSHRRGKERAR